VLAISAALKFRASLGEAAVMQYIHTLGWNAANAIAKLWKTSLLVFYYTWIMHSLSHEMVLHVYDLIGTC
jgi:hypothetical protein